MKEFRQHLDKASLDALGAHLGSKIQSFLISGGGIDARSAQITVP
jgi:hypothetical protein